MTKTIWKFPLQIDGDTDIEIPEGAEILCLQTQYTTPAMWALVDPDGKKEMRRFIIFGTGHFIQRAEHYKYIGTFQQQNGLLVWHLFEDLFPNYLNHQPQKINFVMQC